MNGKLKIKMTVDVLMIVLLMLLMSFELVGDEAHEWIGMGMFLLHHFLNRKWTGNLRKGKYTPFRTLQVVLVVLLLLAMSGSMISGVILSNYLFKFVKIKGAANLAGTVHMLCAYWGFLLMSIHLGIHWNMVVGMAALIVIYGIYAFEKRNIADYLFLRSHFVFFDFGEKLFWFLFDYVAVMGMIVAVTYYVCRLMAKRQVIRKEQA